MVTSIRSKSFAFTQDAERRSREEIFSRTPNFVSVSKHFPGLNCCTLIFQGFQGRGNSTLVCQSTTPLVKWLLRAVKLNVFFCRDMIFFGDEWSTFHHHRLKLKLFKSLVEKKPLTQFWAPSIIKVNMRPDWTNPFPSGPQQCDALSLLWFFPPATSWKAASWKGQTLAKLPFYHNYRYDSKGSYYNVLGKSIHFYSHLHSVTQLL